MGAVTALRSKVRKLWPSETEFEDDDDLVRATTSRSLPFGCLLNFADETWLIYLGPAHGTPWLTLGGMRLRLLMLNVHDRPIWQSRLLRDD